MLLLLGIGFLGGLITGVSPCIVPVLPVIFVGGATSTDRRRPYAIIAGLIVSFSVFLLTGVELLRLLHLPLDTLTDVGIALLFVVALGLIFPKLGTVLERPFARLGLKRQTGARSGFVLGISLGLVFVPCAGPVLTALTVAAQRERVGLTAVLLTFAYAIGASIPLLVFAVLSQRGATSWSAVRRRAPVVRRFGGVVVAITAFALVFNWLQPLQTSVPGYTSALEAHIEGTDQITKQLDKVSGEKPNKFAARSSATSLPNLGAAPQFTGIVDWLNTPGNKALTLKQLRGKVVLVDFWTYSCINCIRTLPHVEAWYQRYKSDGLVVVGVQAPEFAFEHVISNVVTAAARLGVHYPIAVDNNLQTWAAYRNNYWPAEYLIDQSGDVRHTNFGEGDYSTTENDIRQLLQNGNHKVLPPPTSVPNLTPNEPTTPETYLGYSYNLEDYVGSTVYDDIAIKYTAPSSIPNNGFAFSGIWTVGSQSATAGHNAAIHLTFTARDVYLVLGGHGTINVFVNSKFEKTVKVSGIPRLYNLVSSASTEEGKQLELRTSSGVAAYDFTFG